MSYKLDILRSSETGQTKGLQILGSEKLIIQLWEKYYATFSLNSVYTCI
jgi:hypothetical protein